MQDGEKVKGAVRVKYKVSGCRCDSALCPNNCASQRKETAQGLHKPKAEEGGLPETDRHYQRGNTRSGTSEPAWSNQGTRPGRGKPQTLAPGFLSWDFVQFDED